MKYRLNVLRLALIEYVFSGSRVTSKGLTYILILLFTQSTLTWGQKNRVDSLQRLLQTTLPDSTRIDIFLRLANEANNDKTIKIKFYEEALAGASDIQDQGRLHQVIIDYTQWLRENSDQSDSIELIYERGLKLLTIPEYLIPIYYIQGEFYFGQGKDDAAKKSINKGIELAEKNNLPWNIARGFVVLGNGQFYKLEYEKAFSLYAKADSVCDANEELSVSPIRAKILNYMGYAVRITHGYEKAVDYYFKAKDIYQELNDLSGVQEVNLGLTQYYTNIGEYEKAERLLSQAIGYYRDKGPQSSYTYAIISRGYFFLKQKQFDAALKDYQLYYDIAFDGTNKLFQLNALNYMSYLYYEMKKLKLAAQFGEDGIKLSKQINERESRKSIYEQLILIYTESEATNKLNQTYKDYIALRDELDSIGKDKEIYELETKYQTEKKEQQIKLLGAQNQLAEQERRNQLYILLGVVALVLVFAIVFYVLYRNRQKVAKKLKDLDSAKSNFFANISHELRTPLTLIKGPVEQQLSQEDLDDNTYTNLLMISRNADQLLSLVNQLLDLSKLDAGVMKLNVQEGAILSDARIFASFFKYAAEQKNIDYTVDIASGTDRSWYDKDAVEKILMNLLSNAIKYTPNQGEVCLLVYLLEGYVNIEVKNDGRGLNKDEVKKIFERFYQADASQEGAGIGLALVNELVTLHKGSLIFDSQEYGWSTFKVRLPITKDAYTASELNVDTEASTITKNGARFRQSTPYIERSTDMEKADAKEGEKPILLVVEDNEDVRSLIKKQFNKTYSVLEAKDGKEGMVQAFQAIPDIIISDVMMPGVDGVEFAKTLKEDERTSHIPIILLTAKAGEANEIEGLKTGVDDYVVKPFSHEVLAIRVEKLIELRANLRMRYSQEVMLKPQEIAVSSTDEKFLERVQALLDEKLTDTDFNAGTFSEEIGMSRMQLHRKLKALVGLTTTEFIRSQRLKMSTQLLKSSRVNISEVGYAVGFNDPSYFSKCFKKAYGFSPSEYAESHSDY